jgi:hypothetical protein
VLKISGGTIGTPLQVGRDLHPALPLCCMLKRRWWHHRHTAAGGKGLAPCSATLLHVGPALAAPALAAPALWAEEKVSAIVCRMMGRGGYLCIPQGSFTRRGGVESVRTHRIAGSATGPLGEALIH